MLDNPRVEKYYEPIIRIWALPACAWRLIRIRHQQEVDRAGFEPAASALRRRRSYQTELPALTNHSSFFLLSIIINAHFHVVKLFS